MSIPWEADYIICGAGIAGLTLAARLSKHLGDVWILVVEAGDDPTVNPHVQTVAGYNFLQPSEQAWSLETTANSNLKGRSSTVHVGKAISGSAAINGAAWTRGPGSDYDLWAEIVGDDSWSYNALLPYFHASESDSNPDHDPPQHGSQGPVKITAVTATRHYPLRSSLQQAWSEVGVSYVSDGNNGHPNGLTQNLEVWKDGKRQLPSKFIDLSKVTTLPNSLIKRIILSESGRRRATGIELADGTHINAHREVIISAGVYHTPGLLLRSGIGPASELEKHNITSLLHNEHVGAHLVDHLAVGTTWKLKQSHMPERGLAMGHPDFMSRPEYFLGWPLDFIHFDKLPNTSSKELAKLNPDGWQNDLVCRNDATHYETVFLYAPMGAKFCGIDAPMDGLHVTSISVLLTPTSRGSIKIRSADPNDPPLIDVNFNATESDRCILRYALRKANEVLTSTPTGKSMIEEEVPPSGFAKLSSEKDEDLDERIAQFGFSLDHPMGSCRMSKTREEGVVDSHCRVWGVEGLRVVDASVLPVPIAAHIQVCVYALAERVGAWMADGE